MTGEIDQPKIIAFKTLSHRITNVERHVVLIISGLYRYTALMLAVMEGQTAVIPSLLKAKNHLENETHRFISLPP